MRLRRPLDHFELHDWLSADWGPMIDAMAVIWIRGDQQGIRLANDVVNRCADLMTMPNIPDPLGWRERLTRLWSPVVWPPEVVENRNALVKSAATARRALANYVRDRSRQDEADLFAGSMSATSPGVPTRGAQDTVIPQA